MAGTADPAGATREVDRLVSVDRGGSNAREPVSGAGRAARGSHGKHRLENALRDDVCPERSCRAARSG
jgi:hypothetical protein